MLVRPVMIDVPHYASLRDVTRQLVVWRSFDGDKWTRHDDVITSRECPTGSDDEVDLVHSTSDQLSGGPSSDNFITLIPHVLVLI